MLRGVDEGKRSRLLDLRVDGGTLGAISGRMLCRLYHVTETGAAVLYGVGTDVRREPLARGELVAAERALDGSLAAAAQVAHQIARVEEALVTHLLVASELRGDCGRGVDREALESGLHTSDGDRC
ncbi:hypothetical protein PMAYCL1PPCAC_20545 [Pristionchus mayeri]|uniref:Uncharacterized protein n=1 Tax=Pristionchus mayeri TaxID=1317129 RepID=A0AAN5CTY2_9BILA|nr:hypothetical protein PMAYCL1PPCAC_20545 [Pristionchus mayeri]